MGFRLVLQSVTLNDLERLNGRRDELSLLNFLLNIIRLIRLALAQPAQRRHSKSI